MKNESYTSAVEVAMDRMFASDLSDVSPAAIAVALEMKSAANAPLITCKECGHLAEQGRMHSGHLIPICVACKAKADNSVEAACARIKEAFDKLPIGKPWPTGGDNVESKDAYRTHQGREARACNRDAKRGMK